MSDQQFLAFVNNAALRAALHRYIEARTYIQGLVSREVKTLFDDICGDDLRALGSMYVGNGHFSIVVECPWDNKKVIKIGLGSKHQGRLDDDWLRYALFCMSDFAADTVLALPVYELHIEKQMFFALMPKLRHRLDTFGEPDAMLAERINLGMVAGRREDDVYFDDAEVDAAYELGSAMKCFLGNVNLDVHSDNIMEDENGRLYVVDPCAFSVSGGRLDTSAVTRGSVYVSDDAELEAGGPWVPVTGSTLDALYVMGDEYEPSAAGETHLQSYRTMRKGTPCTAFAVVEPSSAVMGSAASSRCSKRGKRRTSSPVQALLNSQPTVNPWWMPLLKRECGCLKAD